MPESETGQERTIPLTPRRRHQLREEGTVARSMEINSVAVLVVGTLVFYFLINRTLGDFGRLIVDTLERQNDWTLDEDEVFSLALETARHTLWISMPYLVLLALAALLANFAQVGVILTGKPLAPRLDRISPLSGWRRLFSWRGTAEMIKSMVKIGVVGYVAYLVIDWSMPMLAQTVAFAVGEQLAITGSLSLRLMFWCTLALLVLALADFGFQHWQYEREHRLTPDELKRELRETEGDPQVRARVRQIQREMARRRMMAEVPRADVVITNPTEFAVALRYRSEECEAPVVLAKGRGFLAARIREIAEEHEIPIVENPPLAQALYKAVKPGMEIPEHLYTAVAEVLAYVHKMGQLSAEVIGAPA